MSWVTTMLVTPSFSRMRIISWSMIALVTVSSPVVGSSYRMYLGCREIARQPKYILYDEPTTGLDTVTSAIIDQLMIRMREKLGVTSIVVTHDMRSAYTVASRIAMLFEGKVRQVGTVDEIQHTRDPVVRQFIEGKPDLDAVDAGV